MSDGPIEIQYNDRFHSYRVDGRSVPSVTEVIDDTGGAVHALTWWGMRIGMAGAVRAMGAHDGIAWAELASANTPAEIIRPSLIEPARQHFRRGDRKKLKPKSRIEVWVQDHQLTPNDIKEEEGLKGTEVHWLLEQLGAGDVPDLDALPEERRGYGRGLYQWYLDLDPVFHEQEMIVGSRRHGYAGRFDALLTYGRGTRKKLTDLKTSTAVRLSYGVQLSAYKQARIETLGIDPEDPEEEVDLEVLWVDAQGRYMLVPFYDGFPVFERALGLWRARQDYLAIHNHEAIAEVASRKKGRWG
jgi:hypothetical protein